MSGPMNVELHELAIGAEFKCMRKWYQEAMSMARDVRVGQRCEESAELVSSQMRRR